MFSAIVVAPTGTPALPIVRTLAALVPAVVHGLLRDLTLACPPGADYAGIADHAGCHLAANGDAATALGAAIAGAREDWVLLLLAGFAPQDGFIDEAGDFIAGGRARAGLLRKVPEGFWTRLFPDWAGVAGVLGPTRAFATGEDFAILAARATPRQTLNARARRVV